MDIIITIVYLVLFIIMMVFVFSIAMLKPFMSKKEMVLILAVGFFIGALGGAFFLTPIYSDIPEVATAIEKVTPGNQETLYLDLSSAVDINKLRTDLSKIEGFKSLEETGVTIPLWSFTDREFEFFNSSIPNMDSHFQNYKVNKTEGTVYIALNNYSSADALKTFSEWYKDNFDGPINYAQVHAKIVISSSAYDQVKSVLLSKGIVASSMEGSIQNSIDNSNTSMVSNTQFVVACGGIGVLVAVLGLFYEHFVVGKRRFRRFLGTKKKR